MTHRGLRDILRGPTYITETLPEKLDEIRDLRKAFPDTHYSKSLRDFPEPLQRFTPPATAAQSGARGLLHKALSGVRALLTEKDGTKDTQPQTLIPAEYSGWEGGVEAFNGVSSALVVSPDRSSLTWLRRDNKRCRKMLREGRRMTRVLMKRWEQLSAQYREAEMASIDNWAQVFGKSNEKNTPA